MVESAGLLVSPAFGDGEWRSPHGSDSWAPGHTPVPDGRDNPPKFTEKKPDELNLKGILMDVKTSLRTKDGKMDLLTARLDQVKQWVDTHESRLDGLENRISDIDDQQFKSREHQLKIDKVLDVIKAKNEDLEARSRRSNIHLTGIPESAVISKMEDFVESMLRNMFGTDLSPVIIVERAQRPCTPPGTPTRTIRGEAQS
ncbi:hypothetical protein NDU88_006613 [Pleurodeles waltl]|uniref:Uncharacterized protein n=1 Tax=Pleurodeles waltl TaxID=8319 RepID=A0AAV7RPB4_PLEWA|nr:hypothetical protein NDU88_006613 [Pleurodeles waltl]